MIVLSTDRVKRFVEEARSWEQLDEEVELLKLFIELRKGKQLEIYDYEALDGIRWITYYNSRYFLWAADEGSTESTYEHDEIIDILSRIIKDNLTYTI